VPQIPVQGTSGLPTELVVGGRTIPVLLPNAYNARTKRYRLYIFLHSYGSNATSTLNRWFGDENSARNSGKGAVVLLPSGLTDNTANTYWNSTDPCCALDATSPPSDVTFLRDAILAAMAAYSIDPNDIHVFGYSNGGGMAHTLALCHPDLVASCWSFAGFAPASGDSHYCTPGFKVHVTHVHGDSDTIVVYPGDPTGAIVTDKPTGIYPGAVASVEQWKTLNGCTGALAQYDTADLTAGIVGSETSRQSYPGQAANGSVELWQIVGGSHVQGMNASFLRARELRQYQCVRT
jgi:polyhydroxybutyrate depolymerase